jgi:hypothetical protein
MFERSVFGKVKNINSLVQEIMNNKLQYRCLFNCSFGEHEELACAEWPKNIPGLSAKNMKS